jgi:hypothetical protein
LLRDGFDHVNDVILFNNKKLILPDFLRKAGKHVYFYRISNLGRISDVTLPIEISKTGDITWSPGDVYDTSCDIDTTYYPFDVQTCAITLTTRGYSKNQLSLKLDKVPIVLNAYHENGEWELVKTSSSTSTVDRDRIPFSQINFSFTFKRRSAFHIMNTIIPMFLLVSMTCFVFRIPVDAGEKLGYCLTVLLAFAVYLTLVSDDIPTTSTHICYLCKYNIIYPTDEFFFISRLEKS